MRLGKRYLRQEINSDTLSAICKYYDELHSELVKNASVVKCSQTAEDLLHTAIMHVASNFEVSDDLSVIVEAVKHKYHSLRVGLDKEEYSRKEVLTDYANDL